MGMNFHLGTRWQWKAWLECRKRDRIFFSVYIVKGVCACVNNVSFQSEMCSNLIMACTWVRLVLWSYLIFSYLILSYVTQHPWVDKTHSSGSGLHVWPECSRYLWDVWWSCPGWKEGLPRQISHSCLVSSRLTSTGQFEGVFALCYVRQRNMDARVSSTSCCRAMLSTALVVHHRSSAVAVEMLWAQLTNNQTLSPASSFYLLPCGSSFILELNVVWKVFDIFPPSHVHILNIKKESRRQSKWAMQGTVLVLPAAAGPLKVSSELFSMVQGDDVLMVLLILIS